MKSRNPTAIMAWTDKRPRLQAGGQVVAEGRDEGAEQGEDKHP